MEQLTLDQLRDRTSGAIVDPNAVPAHILAAADAYDAQQSGTPPQVSQTGPAETVQQPEPVEAPEVAEAGAPDSNYSYNYEQQLQNETTAQQAPAPKPRKDYAQVSAEKDASIRALREMKERAEWERDQMLKLLKENREYMQPPKAAPTPEPEEELFESDIDVVQAKHVKKILNPVLAELKAVKEELNSYRRQNTVSTDELRLKSQYPDFDKVVTSDNVKRFATAYPELARSIDATQDMFAKGTSIYQLIKQFGIAQEDVNHNYQETINKNLQKPRPISSVSPQVGSTALSRANPFANGMSKEIEEQLRNEMLYYSSKY